MKNFLHALWPHPPAGDLSILLLPSTRTISAPLSDVLDADDDADHELRAMVTGENVYFGVGLRTPGLAPGKRGGKQSVVAMPGWVIDFDFAHPDHPDAHKAKDLPTEEEVLSVLFTGAPEPSVVVRSGHGFHGYWLFERPWILGDASDRVKAQTAYKAFWQQFNARAAARGWAFDNTASIERVWRLPGFVNQKSGIEVTIEHIGEARYDAAALMPVGAKAPTKAATAATSGKHIAPIENPTAPQDVLAALASLSKSNENKKAVAQLLAGQSFAVRGERDVALHRLCSVIAWCPASKPYDAGHLAEIFRPSLTLWSTEDDATKSLDEEMAKAVDKIERAQQDKLDKDEIEHRKLAGLNSVLHRLAASEVTEPGTVADPAAAVADMDAFVAHHAIIQVKSSYWIYDFSEERYVGPKIKDEILTTARDAWKNGPNTFILTRFTAKGGEVAKSVTELMHGYGTVAKEVIGKLSLQASFYDVTNKKFFEAICPLRVAEPVYDEQIATWLSLLAGPQHDKLLDWIAAVPQLDKQSCALHLDGAPGAGKGLLAAGLARLWREGGATPLENVLGSFNAEMFRCPLILLDEGLPENRGNVSAEIRRLIGTSTHSLTEKFVVTRDVQGAVRFLIAANNDNVLAFGDENMTANDLAAIISRFLRIGAHPEASAWLEANNVGGALTKSWVEDDRIAKHCLWLRDNRDLVPGKRFLVEGTELDEMHRKLVMQGDGSGQIYEWLARFTSDPETLYASYRTKKTKDGKKVPSLALIGDGQILVNAQGLLDNWSNYMGEEIRRPSTTKVGSTLSKLAAGTRLVGPKGAQVRYHVVRSDLVIGWSIENQIGNEGEITRLLENPPFFAAPEPRVRPSR